MILLYYEISICAESARYGPSVGKHGAFGASRPWEKEGMSVIATCSRQLCA